MTLGAVRDGPAEESDEGESGYEDDPAEDVLEPVEAAALALDVLGTGRPGAHRAAARQAGAQVDRLLLILFL